MDETGVKESGVICENSQGLQITGSIIQLGRHEVIFEVYSPAAVIQTSEVLDKFKIQLRDQAAHSGRAVVKNVVQTGTKLVCAAALDDGLQLQFSAAELQPGRMKDLY